MGAQGGWKAPSSRVKEKERARKTRKRKREVLIVATVLERKGEKNGEGKGRRKKRIHEFRTTDPGGSCPKGVEGPEPQKKRK